VSARSQMARLLLGAEAAIVLTCASVAVRVLGPTRTTRLLGRAARPSSSSEAGAPPGARVRRLGRAVERVARLLPWHPKCLPQAIATKAMLRRRGIACYSHLGVIYSDPVTAHAWITVGGTVVQGAPVGHVTELALFR
jgi:Transglutaminase-like superfamily